MTDLSAITRVHVVAYGRSYEFWADNWRVFVQDGGQTLKLFQQGTGAQHRGTRDTSLAEEITEVTAELREERRRRRARGD